MVKLMTKLLPNQVYNLNTMPGFQYCVIVDIILKNCTTWAPNDVIIKVHNTIVNLRTLTCHSSDNNNFKVRLLRFNEEFTVKVEENDA